MSLLASDLRVATRRLRRRPAFTAIAVASLALGIGANSAAFSLVDAILLRRAPIPDRERVAEIYQKQSNFPYSPFSIPDYVDFRAATRSIFSRMSISLFAVAPRDLGNRVESLAGELVNGDYFPLLGLVPAAGRLLGPEDDVTPGAHPVVVLSYAYWQRSFGGDPRVVGTSIRLGGRAYTIVGVAPKSYAGMISGLAPSFFASIQMLNQIQPDVRDQLTIRGNHSAFMKVRLAPGASMAQARSAAATFTAEMARRYPKEWSPGTELTVIPSTSIAVNPILDGVVVPAAATLLVVVAIVLLVACSNLASFLLAQALDRRREVAVRLALGAGRGSLIRQMLIEAGMLATIGGAAGLVLAQIVLRAVLSADLPVPIPITLDVSIDSRILLFSLGATAVATLFFGLLPALQATRFSVIETVKSENTGGGAPRRLTLRGALVMGQVAASMMLLVVGSLFLRSMQASAGVDPGFGKTPAAMLWIGLPVDHYDSTSRLVLQDDIVRKVGLIAGVRAVGITDNMLLNTLSSQQALIRVPNVPPPKGQDFHTVDVATADSGFFEAAGVRLISGRTFTHADGPHAPRVAIVNEAMARRFWPGREAVGQTFSGDSDEYHVIGVIRDTKVHSLSEAPLPFIYMSASQRFKPGLFVVAQVSGDERAAQQTALHMMATLRDVDPDIMVVKAGTLSQHLATMLLPARLGAAAFSAFALLALLLAVLGVYGVVSYAVARRSREVGIRLAIGAQPASIVRMLMGDGLRLVAVGAGIGLLLSWASARALGSLLYGVGTADPATFIAAPAILFAAGVLATLVPARRALRVDPVTVLRTE